MHNFCPSCGDGDDPFSLVLGKDGNFYGCTIYSDPPTLFRITPAGKYTLLHTFSVSVDGAGCIGMITASDGNIYGTTVGALGLPTVLFRVTTSTGNFTVLHTWEYSQFSVSPPTETSDGTLWGTLSHIAGKSAYGMYEIGLSSAGYHETALPYSFNTVQFLLQASDENFWAPSADVLSFSIGGQPLQQIAVQAEGSLPAVLMPESDGNLVGVTNNGGFEGSDPGEIFTIEPGLPAPAPLFVNPFPSSGKVGAQIIIHGAQFVETTEVKFNGASAGFKVLNTGNILTTVPNGATTGPISVTNAGGTTESKKRFVVE